MADTLNIGDATTRTVTFAVNGTPTNPTTTTATLYLPDGTTSSPSITNGSTGVRSVTITPTMAGTHRLKWAGTGAVAEVEWDVFEVVTDPAWPLTNVLSIGEAKAALPGLTGTDSDLLLGQYVAAVTAVLDDLCGPIVARTITDEAHTDGGDVIFLRHHPASSVTTVTEYSSGTATVLTAETMAAAGTYLFNSTLGTITRRTSWTNTAFGASGVLVTYVAGRYATTAAVDPKFKVAAQIMLAQIWRSEQATGTDTFGALPTANGFIPTFAIPNAARQLLAGELRAPAIA